MRGHTLDHYAPLFEDDGSIVTRTDPRTGTQIPFSAGDCDVTLNGEVCYCVFADEAAGIVLVTDHKFRPDIHPLTDYRVLKGEVKIILKPLPE